MLKNHFESSMKVGMWKEETRERDKPVNNVKEQITN
jgi:hypothetical protein